MAAYYNEFDPGAAAWLRELIRKGHIADGEVDERSILEVTADDLHDFTQCHFFAGIGGWSYALRLAGIPDDMKVWTGSPPCQPFSTAGQQKGKDDERHLAPHFAALVAAGRPPILFGEQVASAAVFGKATRKAGSQSEGKTEWAWIDDLQSRLEDAHYAVGVSDIPAAGVGAPQIRQRTFFGAVRLAYTECGEWGKVSLCGLQQADGSERIWQAAEFTGGCDGHGLADADHQRSQGRPRVQECSGQRPARKAGMDGRPCPYNEFWRDSDWLFCRDGKWRPVEPGTFPLANGIPARVVRLRGYGNAIVPQAAATFIDAFIDAAS